MALLPLPAGLTFRPLTLSDADAVVALIWAEELEDLGSASIEAADILSFWERPSFDLQTSTVGVFDGAELVGYAELTVGSEGAAAVHPRLRGQGVGTALAGWLESAARAQGFARLGAQVAQGSPADQLLATLGYAAGWTAWDLALPSREALVPSEPPAGYVLREARSDEIASCWSVIEEAFLEWADRRRRPLEDWQSLVTGRQGFLPWHLRVAAEATGQIAAVCVLHHSGGTALIDQLATRADQRGRGLASALITDAVVTSAANGANAWTIATDTRSGARALYERLGMQVTSTWLHREIDLR